MRDFVIVHILDDYKIGKLFTMWPLHVTILPPFKAPDVEDVEKCLEPIAKSTPPIDAELGSFEAFGEKRTARLVLPNTNLSEVHTKILQAIELNGFAVNGRYVGSNYKAHISTTKGGREFGGDKFIIDKIQIVESLPQGYRKVVAELDLQ